MTPFWERKTKKIKLVMSDLHMGKGRVLEDGSINVLEDFLHDRQFIEFLEYYSTGQYKDYEVELVFNGDCFNLLQVDYYETFPEKITEGIAVTKMESIIKGHEELFEALRLFCDSPRRNLTIIIGNHDPGLFWEGVQSLLKEKISPEINIFPHYYDFDGVYIEHGHQYEYLHHLNPRNAIIDKGVPEPIMNLTWGNLFLIQFLNPLKKERPYIDKIKPFRLYLRWAFINDMMFFFKIVFGMTYFYLKNRLKADYRHRSKFKFHISRIKEAWVHTSVENSARRLLKNTSYHTVIFGHTHQHQYRQYKDYGEYFNVGCWTDHVSLDISNPGRFTKFIFALISYEDNHERPHTYLKQWYGHARVEDDILF